MDPVDTGRADRDTVTTVAGWIAAAGRVVVLTGAGISTASGIPDFRGPQGVMTRDPGKERLFSFDAYVGDAEVRREAWRMRSEHPAFAVEPNAGHRALAELEALGRLDTLVTQNVDGLHQRGGSDPARVIEIHGTVHEVACLACGRRVPAGPVLQRVREGDPDPCCDACGGMQKSATVSFGQALDPVLMQRAHGAAAGCEVFLAVGSSLVVHPVALLPQVALDAGARLVVINGESTPYDVVADAVLTADVTATLTAIVDEVRRHVSP